jgi:hypothetical protein
MRQLCMAAMRREDSAPRLPQITGIRRVASAADVAIIDRKASLSGLYALDKITVRANARPEDKKQLLAKCKEDLSKQEREDLDAQGIGILWIRETPGVPGMVGGLSSEKNAGKPDELYGTKVVPYIVLSGAQAESIANMAEQLPMPEEPKRYVPELPKGMLMSMAWVGPGC